MIKKIAITILAAVISGVIAVSLGISAFVLVPPVAQQAKMPIQAVSAPKLSTVQPEVKRQTTIIVRKPVSPTPVPTDLASYPCARDDYKVSVADHVWVCLKHSPPFSLREIEQTYHANFGTYDNPSWDPSDNCSDPIAGCLAANQGFWNVVNIDNGYFHDMAGFYKIYPADGCANTIDCQIYWPIQIKP